MALNQFMHPRNIYKLKKPDFKELAVKNAAFRAAVSQDLKGRVVVDFTNPRCLKALTCALLKEDFGIDIEIPDDRLVPAVPQRLNYILWIEDLLDGVGSPGSAGGVTGLDVGTGSSCVYPLLGAKLKGWRFYASEIDATNVKYASANVRRNEFQESIKVVQVDGSTILKDVVSSARAALGSESREAGQDREELFDFCMCNPPFFSSDLDAEGASSNSSEGQGFEASSERPLCPAGADVERTADGGDEQFVKRMVDESIALGRTIRLYTSMFGKKASLGKVKAYLREKGITNFTSTTFCQGRTMRWAVAWTFDPSYRFPKSLVEAQKKEQRDRKPIICLISRASSDLPDTAFSDIARSIRDLLDELEMSFTIVEAEETAFSAIVSAKRNTWTHQRRKRRQHLRSETEAVSQTSTPSDAKVLCTGHEHASTAAHGMPAASPVNSLVETSAGAAGDMGCCPASTASAARLEADPAGPVASTAAEAKAVLMRFVLTLTWVPGSGTAMTMRWLEGENRELMHQVMQFLKNRLQPPSVQQQQSK